MTYKDFVANAILTDTDMDLVMRQTVMQFTTTTQRDTQLSGVLAGGMRCWTSTTPAQTEWLYNGSSWDIISEPPQTWTPSLSQGVSVTNTLSSGWWSRTRYTFTGAAHMICTGSGTATNTIVVGLPFTLTNVDYVVGHMLVIAASNSTYSGMVVANNTSTVKGMGESGTAPGGIGSAPNVQLTNTAHVYVEISGRLS